MSSALYLQMMGTCMGTNSFFCIRSGEEKKVQDHHVE